jgi:hypothetical protein
MYQRVSIVKVSQLRWMCWMGLGEETCQQRCLPFIWPVAEGEKAPGMQHRFSQPHTT